MITLRTLSNDTPSCQYLGLLLEMYNLDMSLVTNTVLGAERFLSATLSYFSLIKSKHQTTTYKNININNIIISIYIKRTKENNFRAYAQDGRSNSNTNSGSVGEKHYYATNDNDVQIKRNKEAEWVPFVNCREIP